MNKQVLTGGCLCRKVRYTISSEPLYSIQCYCTDCQKISGAGHAPQFAVKADSVELSGETKSFMITTNEYNVESAFCPECGCPVYKITARFPDRMYFPAASLDDPAKFKPGKNVWPQSKQPWDLIQD